MRDEALWLTFLHPGDPLGHSLRAKALRELQEFGDALAEYDSALALTARDDPQYLDLVIQRSETLLRMGRYEGVLVAAQEALGHWPDRPIFQYHIFCARTALLFFWINRVEKWIMRHKFTFTSEEKSRV